MSRAVLVPLEPAEIEWLWSLGRLVLSNSRARELADPAARSIMAKLADVMEESGDEIKCVKCRERPQTRKGDLCHTCYMRDYRRKKVS